MNHTDRLQKEGVIVEIILDKRDRTTPLRARSLHNNIQCPLSCTITLYSLTDTRQELRTSSSMSINEPPRASYTASKLSAPLSSSLKPRRPRPRWSQPARPLVHGSEINNLGVCLSAIAAITNKSGNPSKFVSPRRTGRGSGGENVVSSTRSELEEPTREEKRI